MSRYFAALSIAPALLLSQIPFSQQGAQPDLNQRLAMYSKPAIVRVLAICSGVLYYKGEPNDYDSSAVGSGFFIDPNGYIVTNAHVANLAEGGKAACRKRLINNVVKKVYGAYAGKSIQDVAEISDQDAVRSIESEVKLSEEDLKYYSKVILPNGNVAAKEGAFDFEIKERGSPVIDDKQEDIGKDVAVIKIEVTDAPVLPLGDSSKVEIQDPVIVLGYPDAADAMSVLNDKSAYEASVLTGQVANTRKELKNSSPVLQLNVTVSGGSSGSPVLNKDGEVIGMVTFRRKGIDEETSFPYAVPTNTIQEFTRKSGAANKLSDTDLLYKEGLDLYWKGDFEGAKAKFEAVRGLFPGHSEIDELIRLSGQQIANRWANRSYLPLLAGVGVAIAGLLGAYFIARRRSAPAFADGLADTGMNDTHATAQSERDRHRSGRSSVFHSIATVLSAERRPSSTVTTLQSSLELKNSQREEQRFSLQKDSHRLGRDRKWADLQVPDEGWGVVSGRHAILQREGESYRIYDGDGNGKVSTNGLSVNGVLVSPEGYLLKDGDRLKIGQDPHNQVDIVYHTVNRPPASRSEANSRDGNG